MEEEHVFLYIFSSFVNLYHFTTCYLILLCDLSQVNVGTSFIAS